MKQIFTKNTLKSKPFISFLGLVILLLTVCGYKANMAHRVATDTHSPLKTALQAQNVTISGKNQNTPNANTQNITDKAIKTKPHLYLLYKTGCPVCQNIFPTEERIINNLDSDVTENIYYVNWESTLGKQLQKKYNLEWAYSAVLEYDGGGESYLLKDNDFIENTLITITNQLKLHMN